MWGIQEGCFLAGGCEIYLHLPPDPQLLYTPLDSMSVIKSDFIPHAPYPHRRTNMDGCNASSHSTKRYIHASLAWTRSPQTWGIDPADMLMVGDSFEDVECGNASGAASCLIAGRGTPGRVCVCVCVCVREIAVCLGAGGGEGRCLLRTRALTDTYVSKRTDGRTDLDGHSVYATWLTACFDPDPCFPVYCLGYVQV